MPLFHFYGRLGSFIQFFKLAKFFHRFAPTLDVILSATTALPSLPILPSSI